MLAIVFWLTEFLYFIDDGVLSELLVVEMLQHVVYVLHVDLVLLLGLRPLLDLE